MKAVYPTIFTKTEDCYLIEVPDLEILSEGTDLENAIEMARDAICLTIISLEDNNQAVPVPSPIDCIDIAEGTFANDGKGFLSMVDADTMEYRRKNDMKMVRRNVTLPSWLDYAAEKSGINVSAVLQRALKSELNLSDV